MFLSRSSVPKPPVSELSSGKRSDGDCTVANVNLSLGNSKTIFTDCANGSKLLRVAYQGVPGAYSEAAAMKAFPNCEPVPAGQFEDAMKAAEQRWVETAVIPIENSVGGSVHRNYDLLLSHTLHIVGETHLLVDHCLLGLPGVTKEELKCVFSHPQALAQCEMSLKKLGVSRLSPAANTAGAAKIVASDGIRENGAIASARAAEIYGLNVLAQKFQDVANNVTRFLVLAREPIIPANVGPYKTSVVFTLKDGPGALVEALAVFTLRGINLFKIESRPLEKHPLKVVNGRKYRSNMYFDYFFYIDFEASTAEPRAQYALEHLEEFAKFLRVLGCYPMETKGQFSGKGSDW